MSIWNAKLTKKGDALLAKLTQGHTLEITHAEIGSGTVDALLLSEQTSVSSVKQTAQLQPVGYPEDGRCALPVNITNEGVTASFNAWQIGVFATDPDEGSILFFLAQAEDAATNVPSENLTPSYSTEIIFNVKFGQADSVEVTVDPANTVTQAGMVNYVGTEIPKAFTSERVKVAMDSAEIVTTEGTGAAYTATVPGITALKAGVSFIMVPHTVSTTTQPTLNVNGLGAKPLRQPLTTNTGGTTTATTDSWISSGKPVRVMYDGTLWEIGIPRPSATALYGSVPIYNGGHGGSTVEEARKNLGVAAEKHTHKQADITDFAHTHSASDVNSGTLSMDRLPTVPVTKGGTGATEKREALNNLMSVDLSSHAGHIGLGAGKYERGLYLFYSNEAHTIDISKATAESFPGSSYGSVNRLSNPCLCFIVQDTAEQAVLFDIMTGRMFTVISTEDDLSKAISTEYKFVTMVNNHAPDNTGNVST